MKNKISFALLACLLISSVLTRSVSEPSSAAYTEPVLAYAAGQSASYPFLEHFAIDPSLETDQVRPGDTVPYRYFGVQLNDDARLIYNALADSENLSLLLAGEPVTVGETYTMTIPEKPSQTEYNELVSAFNAESVRLGALLSEMSNAAAAFDRDCSDVFWTSGVYGNTVIKENGIALEGSVSLSPGNTYELSMEVGLHLVSDWDGEGASDRDLSTDITTMKNAVSSIARAAASASTTRYGRLKYINEQLCKYNDYNTAAANANGSDGYGYSYPWTAFAALDQLTVADDANGSLKPVCEGYARAFKLICDELGIPCVLISGTGNNEEHMWNYVQMEDGVWYAVDVTWNDSTRNNGYFLVGKDVMDEDHTTHNRFMATGQIENFLYPILSQKSYDPNKLTLLPHTQFLLGGGALFLLAGGALEGNVDIVCDDKSVTVIRLDDRGWTVELPNITASYTFTATFTGEGVYNGVTATCTVTTEQHTHSYGAWEPHDDGQHKSVCSCGDAKYEDHAWSDEWEVTEEKGCGDCGYTVSVGIPEQKPEDESGETTNGTTASDKPTGNGASSAASSLGELFGCTSAASGMAVVLCAVIGASALVERRRK